MDESLEQIIEIEGSVADTSDLVARIRANIAQRRAQAQTHHVDYDNLAQGLPGFAGSKTLSREIYLNLFKAEWCHEHISVAEDYRRGTLPIIGWLWHQIRRQAHGLVLFYVNKGLAQQMAVNRYVLITLRQLVEEMERCVQIGDGSDMTALRERLARFEQFMAG